jgi:hypothetical protein
LKGESNETKRKAFERNIERGYQKPLKCPLILRTCLHAKHLHLEILPKKKKEAKPKGTPRILIS